MAEEGNYRTEIEHIKSDIIEIKQTMKEDNKETTKEMMGMRDSKIRTEIALENITKSQDALVKTQETMLNGIQDLKDAPHNSWKQMSMAWKISVGMAVISYVGGTLFGLIKAFFM